MDEGDAVSVSGQLSDRLRSVLPQRPSVPHLAQRVVAAGEQQLGGAVGERHCVHVVLVSVDLTGEHGEEGGYRVSVCVGNVCEVCVTANEGTSACMWGKRMCTGM